MRGEAAPYSLVPSAESSLLQEREGEEGADMDIKADNNNITTKVVTSNTTTTTNNNNNKEKKRGWVHNGETNSLAVCVRDEWRGGLVFICSQWNYHYSLMRYF